MNANIKTNADFKLFGTGDVGQMVFMTQTSILR